MPTAGAVRSVCQSGGGSGREGVDVHVAFLKEASPTAWTESATEGVGCWEWAGVTQ
jgi:hypothetical protein